MSLSQFYVLSPRGDSILSRFYRGDLPRSTAETFFRNVKFWNGTQQEAPPIFNLDGINYFYIKKQGLYFVFTNKENIGPSFVIELLNRLTKVFKDYCGVLSEESLRSNFILLYELLDEILDFGYVQGTSTDHLKSYVFNDPVVVHAQNQGMSIPRGNKKTKQSSAVNVPINMRESTGQKNEIFVDIYERISITFNADGYIQNSAIDGSIQMKSYLSGNPGLRLALNEDLVIGKSNHGSAYGALQIDDCNFHECARLDEWDSGRILSLVPPKGEFTVMNYRITSDFRTPFRIFPKFELISPYRVQMEITVRADIPESNYGGSVQVMFPVPKSTSSVSCDLGIGVLGQQAEYNAKERRVYWRIKKFSGGTEQRLRAKISLTNPNTVAIRKELGPISMSFEIPMYNPSNLVVRYLRIIEDRGYKPKRWVRYVTRSSSYVCRL